MSKRMKSLSDVIATPFNRGLSASGIGVANFGCTGHVGYHIQTTLSMHGFMTLLPFRFRAGLTGGQVRALNSFPGEGSGGQTFAIDFEIDKEFVVKSILDKVDNVVNSIGAFQEPRGYQFHDSWYSMEAVNVEWPRMLARWSREMGVLRFVHVSMVGADLNSPSRLLRQKRQAEIAVLEEFPQATIIRSTDMFWEDDNTYQRYLKAQRYWNVTPVPNRGLRIHQPVFMGDIATAVTRALFLEHTEGRIAELGGPVRFTTADLLRWASEVNNGYHMICHMPKPFWKALCYVNERGPRKGYVGGSRAPPWNDDWLERQFIDNVAMPERDPDLLDWEDFGIATEELARLEEKYHLTALVYARESVLGEDMQEKL